MMIVVFLKNLYYSTFLLPKNDTYIRLFVTFCIWDINHWYTMEEKEIHINREISVQVTAVTVNWRTTFILFLTVDVLRGMSTSFAILYLMPEISVKARRYSRHSQGGRYSARTDRSPAQCEGGIVPESKSSDMLLPSDWMTIVRKNHEHRGSTRPERNRGTTPKTSLKFRADVVLRMWTDFTLMRMTGFPVLSRKTAGKQITPADGSIPIIITLYRLNEAVAWETDWIKSLVINWDDRENQSSRESKRDLTIEEIKEMIATLF